MIPRRTLVAAAAEVVLLQAQVLAHSPLFIARAARRRQPDSYADFLGRVRIQALRLGVNASILDVALALDRPNPRVQTLDRHQPEFTLSWSQYRLRVLTERKLQAARIAYQGRLQLLTRIWQRYQVDPRIAVAIWGLESNYGSRSGTFGVVDALATLAFYGRRAVFFHAELMEALCILQQRDIEPDRMLGSYAGAMGQPQFMPSSYRRYAVDYDGDGRRDIWSNEPDVLASISNYLSQNGWSAGAPWGQPVSMSRNLDVAQNRRDPPRPLDEWMRLGVRRADGARFSRPDVTGSLLLPDGAGGDAFMVYSNFNVIRRYNPSDYYGLAVGLLASGTA